MKPNHIQPSEIVPIHWGRFILFWLIGSIPAYFIVGYLSNPSQFQFILLSLFFQIFCGLISYRVFDDANRDFDWHQEWMTPLVLCLALILAIATTVLVWQFPGLFDRRIFFMDSSMLSVFAMLILPSVAGSAWIAQRLHTSIFFRKLRETSLWTFIQHNLAGILLALLFFFVYFTLTQCLNFPGYNTVDQFFDTDISEWLSRLAYLTPDQFMARAVHPAVLIFLRPLVELIAIFLHGDKYQAVFLLNALTGATCVFLIWRIVKQLAGNTTFSLLMAFLLGAGTSHLLLSSLIETYIYSAFALLLFVLLIQSNKTDLRYIIPAGVLVFGITITNLIQTCILYLFKSLQIKNLIKYVIVVLGVTLLLNFIQVKLYHNVMAMYDSANLVFEQKYKINFLENSWVLRGRFILMMRAILLYTVVAPKPFILTTEIGTTIPTFSVFKISIGEFQVAGYTGLADFTVKFWMVILLAACGLFVWNLIRSPRQMSLPLAFAACMGFNLILHTFWGDDPMLYSPDWAYALVLFLAYAFHKWADKKWLQVPLVLFLSLVVIVNLSLIQLMMRTILPFYGR